jgi:hypothetical protein
MVLTCVAVLLPAKIHRALFQQLKQPLQLSISCKIEVRVAGRLLVACESYAVNSTRNETQVQAESCHRICSGKYTAQNLPIFCSNDDLPSNVHLVADRLFVSDWAQVLMHLREPSCSDLRCYDIASARYSFSVSYSSM